MTKQYKKLLLGLELINFTTGDTPVEHIDGVDCIKVNQYITERQFRDFLLQLPAASRAQTLNFRSNKNFAKPFYVILDKNYNTPNIVNQYEKLQNNRWQKYFDSPKAKE